MTPSNRFRFQNARFTHVVGDKVLSGRIVPSRLLLNNVVTDYLSEVSPDDVKAYAPLSAQLQKLTSPAEMGELFKVIALGRGIDHPPAGFSRGDLSRLL